MGGVDKASKSARTKLARKVGKDVAAHEMVAAKRGRSGNTLSAQIAARGIRNSRDFAALMGALMSDLINGGISAGVGIGVTNAGGKLLKVKEMEMKYGVKRQGGGMEPLDLVEAE